MFHELSSKSDEKIFTFSQNLKERFNWLDDYTEEIMKTLGVTSSDGPILVPKVIISCPNLSSVFKTRFPRLLARRLQEDVRKVEELPRQQGPTMTP